MTESIEEDQIKVAVRVRPPLERERSSKVMWKVSENMIQQMNPIPNTTERFTFDDVFDVRCSNHFLYTTAVKPIVHGSLQGYNGTIFAYGQTASGKTHTIMGQQEWGVIPYTIQDIFQTITETPERNYLLRVSYMEIYNEQMMDLLTGGTELKIRENPEKEVYVFGIKEEVVNDPEQILNLLDKGQERRHIGETKMNEKSSRSHTIFKIVIESREKCKEEADGAVIVSQLNIVDLAGSERASTSGATGERLKEGAAINLSLSSLTRVISQLSDKESFISFRDSKLTRILQNSLGGNAKTLIVACVSPVEFQQTQSTLQFASKAKRIQNKPIKNEDLTDNAMLKQAQKEINSLKEQIEQLQRENQAASIVELESQNKKLEDELKRYKNTIINGADTFVNPEDVLDQLHRPNQQGKATKNRRRDTWCPGLLSHAGLMATPPFVKRRDSLRLDGIDGSSGFGTMSEVEMMKEFEEMEGEGEGKEEKRLERVEEEGSEGEEVVDKQVESLKRGRFPSEVSSPGSVSVPKKKGKRAVHFPSEHPTSSCHEFEKDTTPEVKDSDSQTEDSPTQQGSSDVVEQVDGLRSQLADAIATIEQLLTEKEELADKLDIATKEQEVTKQGDQEPQDPSTDAKEEPHNRDEKTEESEGDKERVLLNESPSGVEQKLQSLYGEIEQLKMENEKFRELMETGLTEEIRDEIVRLVTRNQELEGEVAAREDQIKDLITTIEGQEEEKKGAIQIGEEKKDDVSRAHNSVDSFICSEESMQNQSPFTVIKKISGSNLMEFSAASASPSLGIGDNTTRDMSNVSDTTLTTATTPANESDDTFAISDWNWSSMDNTNRRRSKNLGRRSIVADCLSFMGDQSLLSRSPKQFSTPKEKTPPCGDGLVDEESTLVEQESGGGDDKTAAPKTISPLTTPEPNPPTAGSTPEFEEAPDKAREQLIDLSRLCQSLLTTNEQFKAQIETDKKRILTLETQHKDCLEELRLLTEHVNQKETSYMELKSFQYHEVETLDEELKHLRERCAELEKEVTEKQHTVSAVTTVANTDEIVKLRQTTSDAEEMVQDFRQQLSVVQDSLQSETTKYKQTKQDLEKCRKDLDNSKRDVSDYEWMLEEEKKKNKTMVSNLQFRINELEENSKAKPKDENENETPLKAEIEELKGKLEEQLNKERSLQETQDEREKEMQVVRQDCEDKEKRLEGLKNEIETLTVQHQELRKEYECVKEEAQKVELLRAEYEEQEKKAKDDAESFNTRFQQLNCDIETMRQEREELKERGNEDAEKVKGLEEGNRVKEEELEGMQKEMALLTTQLEDLRKENLQLKENEEKGNLSKETEESEKILLQEQEGRLQEQIIALTAEIEQLGHVNQSLTQEIAEEKTAKGRTLEQEQEKNERKVKEVMEEMAHLDTRYQQLRNEYQQFREEKEKTNEAENKEMAELKDKVTKIDEERQQLATQIEEINEESESVRKEKEEVVAEVGRLKGRVAEGEEAKGRLRTELARAEQETEEKMKTTLEQVHKEVTILKEELRSSEEEKEKAVGKRESLEKEMEERGTEFERKEAQLMAELSQIREVSEQQLVETEEIVRKKGEERRGLEDQILQLQERLEAMRKSAEEAEIEKVTQLREYEEQTETWKSAAEKNSTAKDTYETQIAELKEEVEKSATEIEKLNRLVGGLRKTKERLEAECDKMDETEEEYQKEIQQLQEQLQSKRSAREGEEELKVGLSRAAEEVKNLSERVQELEGQVEKQRLQLVQEGMALATAERRLATELRERKKEKDSFRADMEFKDEKVRQLKSELRQWQQKGEDCTIQVKRTSSDVGDRQRKGESGVGVSASSGLYSSGSSGMVTDFMYQEQRQKNYEAAKKMKLLEGSLLKLQEENLELRKKGEKLKQKNPDNALPEPVIPAISLTSSTTSLKENEAPSSSKPTADRENFRVPAPKTRISLPRQPVPAAVPLIPHNSDQALSAPSTPDKNRMMTPKFKKGLAPASPATPNCRTQ